ncbi:unnamed protein product [Cunninghamella echinulata]
MEIAIRKATRLEYRPPKEKHLQTLINLTYHKPALIDEILLTLSRRGKENSWIIVFKVLIIVHTLIRQGNGDQTISRLQKHPEVLSLHRLKEKASAYASIQNLHMYHNYLIGKLDLYRECEVDYTKVKGRLRQLSINNGLLKETTRVQQQIAICLSCKFQIDIGDNAISFNAFRLIVEDLLSLFQVVNEAVVNILEHYFSLSKLHATLALEIYKKFSEQAQATTGFLDNARKLEDELFITIPTLNHAPLSLASALEDYLNDGDFETKRQTIIQEKQRKSSMVSPSTNQPITQSPSSSSPTNNNNMQLTITSSSYNNDNNNNNNNAMNEFFKSLENERMDTLVPYQPQPQQQQQQQLVYSQLTGQQQQLQPIQAHYTGNPFLQQQQQQYPIFPINTNLKRSASLSTSNTNYALTASPLTYNNPNVSLTSLQNNMTGSNPFRFSTLPTVQYKSHPSQHLPIPINTKNPFAISNNNNTIATPPLTPVQNTNPFAKS